MGRITNRLHFSSVLVPSPYRGHHATGDFQHSGVSPKTLKALQEDLRKSFMISARTLQWGLLSLHQQTYSFQGIQNKLKHI